MNIPNEYWSLAQREMQSRSSARSRRMSMLNTIATQHFSTVQTILRLLEAEMRSEQELNLPSANSARMASSQRNPRPYTNFFSPIYSDMRLFNIGGSNAGGTTAAGFTTEQINQITELLPYDLSMNETRCPITWTNFTEGQEVLQIRSCGHVFGPDALRTWFQQNRRCPICRINPIAPNTTAGATTSAAASTNTTNTTTTTTNTTSLENVLDRWMNSITGTDGETTLQYEYTVDLTDLLSAALRGRGRN